VEIHADISNCCAHVFASLLHLDNSSPKPPCNWISTCMCHLTHMWTSAHIYKRDIYLCLTLPLFSKLPYLSTGWHMCNSNEQDPPEAHCTLETGVRESSAKCLSSAVNLALLAGWQSSVIKRRASEPALQGLAHRRSAQHQAVQSFSVPRSLVA